MVTHTHAIKNLSKSDYLLIEKEHRQLNGFLDVLKETCCNLDNDLTCQSCTLEQYGTCRGRLPSFLHDIIDLASKHFINEEKIMLSRPNVTEDYEYFRNHSLAHNEIMRKLNALLVECYQFDKEGDTVSSYRKLFTSLVTIFENHDATFDDPFIESTKS